MLTVIFNLKLYHKPNDEKIPHYLKAMHNLLECTRKKAKHVASNFKNKETDSSDTVGTVGKPEDNNQLKAPLEDDIPEADITWKDISASMDIVCFILFGICTLCSFYVFLRTTYFV
jgi:hypothetical protein